MSGNVCLCTYLIFDDLTGVGQNTSITKNYKYIKKYSHTLLEISFDINYTVEGYQGDRFYSQILVGTTANPTTVLTEHMQISYDATSSGTRSGTLLPIIGVKSELPQGDVYISLKIITNGDYGDDDDGIDFIDNGILIVREYSDFSTLTLL